MQKPDSNPALRLVLDTNAVLDALLFADPRIAAAIAVLAGRQAQWFATPPMRDELAHVLTRPALVRYKPDCERILTTFDEQARMITDAVVGSPRLTCRDPDDQAFIDLAFQLRPATLLTHDRDLLVLARRAAAFGVAVLRPAQFRMPAAFAPGADEQTGSRC